jgi:hypothetical protein
MQRDRPALFKGRHFEAEIIILCVRRYLRYALSLRNLEEMMAERNVYVDHVTIWRWIQRYAPELNRRCRQELRITNRLWRVDETYLRVAGEAEMNKGRLTGMYLVVHSKSTRSCRSCWRSWATPSWRSENNSRSGIVNLGTELKD